MPMTCLPQRAKHCGYGLKQTKGGDEPYLAVVVDPDQRQRGPGELQGFEVGGGPRAALPLDGRLLTHTLRGPTGGWAVEDTHRVQGDAVQDLDAAVVKGQRQACSGHSRVVTAE